MPDLIPGIEMTCTGGEKYEITYYPPEFCLCKKGYYYLRRFVPPNSRVAVARFYDTDEAQRFMRNLYRTIIGKELR